VCFWTVSLSWRICNWGVTIKLFGNIGKVTWGYSSEKTWTLAWCLDLASWQCPCSWCTCCLGVFGKKIDNENELSSIFSRFGPVRLLTIPKTEDRFEESQIFRHCWHSGTCDNHPAEHSRRGVPEMFWAVDTPTH
jgi:hypothetical protein